MGCTIQEVLTKFNKPSELWKSLLESMSTRDALEYYLEIISNEDAYKKLYGENSQGEVLGHTVTSARFKLVEFDTYQDQEDTMDYLSSLIISSLKKQSGIASSSNIVGLNFNAIAGDNMAMHKAIKDVKDVIEPLLAEDVSDKQFNLLTNALLNIDRYLVGEDGRLGSLGKRLQSMGIPFKITETKVITDEQYTEKLEKNGEVDSDTIENKYTRIYDMSILESSPLTSVLSGVRTYIKTKYAVADKYKYVKGEPIRYKKTNLGSNKAIDYEKVMGKLYSGLTGIQTITEMVDKLKVIALTSPEITPILEDVLKEQEGPASSYKVGRKVVNYNPLTTALFSTFSKHNYDMFSIVVEPSGNIFFSNANKSELQEILKTEWKNKVEATKESVSDRIKKKRAEAISSFIKSRELKLALNRSKKPNTRAINMATKFLKDAGFSVTSQDIFALKEVSTKDSRFLKDNSDYASIVNGLLLTLATSTYNDKNVFTSKYGMDEGRYLNLLASVVGKRRDDVMLGAFLGGKNTMIHPLNSTAEAHEVWGRVLSDQEFKELISNDPIYSSTNIYKALQNDAHKVVFRPRTLDSLIENNSGLLGSSYGEMSSTDAVAMKINGYFIGEGNRAYMRAFSPTQGDRGNLETIGVPKLNVDSLGKDNKVFTNDGKVVSSEISDWVEAQLRAEVDRIFSAKKYKGRKTKNYHNGNAEKFNLFPELNDIVEIGAKDKETVVQEAVDNVLHRTNTSKTILRDLVSTDIEFIKKVGLLKATDSFGYAITSYGKEVISPSMSRITTNQLENFLVNNMVYNYEQTLFYVGDIAYFAKNSEKNPFAQKVDLNKRFSLPFTPGTKVAVGSNSGIQPTSLVKIIEEAVITSNSNNILKELFGTKAYANIELADGAGFVSLKRYKQLLMSRGLHTDDILELIDDLIAGKTPSGKATLEVLKGFYFRLQKGDHGSVAPFNLKYSIVPAIPTLYEKKVDGKYIYPAMAKISTELNSTTPGSADEVVLQSAVKVGEVGVTSIDNLSSNKGVIIDNSSYRFPQPSPAKDVTSNLLGSQMRVLAEANIRKNSTYRMFGEDISSNDVIDKYNKAITDITTINSDELVNKFVTNGSPSMENIINSMLDSMDANEYANVSYFKEALALIGEETTLPFNYPTMNFSLDNMINAAFRKKVSRFKVPGYSAVQITSMGMAFSKDITTVGSDLSFVGVEAVGGKQLTENESIQVMKRVKAGEDVSSEFKVTPAEIRVTPKYFLKRLSEIAEKKVSTKLLSAERKEFESMVKEASPELGADAIAIRGKREFDRRFQEEKSKVYNRLKRYIINGDGTYNLNEVKKAGLDKVVLYRIPTQAKSSMLPAVIKGFLPEEFGASIQVPAEIVNQAGSDFDIDKITLEAFSFEERGGKLIKHSGNDESLTRIDRANATIVEFHKSVLESTNTLSELLYPNNTDKLVEVAKKLSVDDSQMTSNSNSLATQELFRNNNKDGKDMIAISSVASVAHALSQRIGSYFKGNFKLNSTKQAVLGAQRSIDGIFISDEIGMIQNAALDNAKDPLLGKLNINEFTSSAVLLAIQLGTGLEYAVTLVNSQVVKDLAREYGTLSRKLTPKAALKEATAIIHYKYKINSKNSVVDLSTYDLDSAKRALDLTSPSVKDNQQIALKAFLMIKEQGDKLATFQRAFNFGSKGTPPSTAQIITKYKALATIPGTLAYYKEKGSSSLLTSEYFSKSEKAKKTESDIAIDPVKYENHSISSYELNAIHKPLEVNKVISPTASTQIQEVASTAKNLIGPLTTGMEMKLTASYYQYLLLNKNAIKGESSSITEFMDSELYFNMTNPTSPNSTANLLKQYNQKVINSGETPNLFLENLVIEKVNGREYITFRNTVSRALTGDRKASMMFYFESLMDSDNGSLEARLAESLTLYALTHYGYTKDKNSFMEFVPPLAHQVYGANILSPAEFFRGIDFNNKEVFNDDTEVFIDMFVRNNALRLPITRIHKNAIVDFKNSSGRDVTYVLQAKDNTWKSFTLHKKGIGEIGFLGIPNYVSEYSVSGESKYQDAPLGIDISSKVKKSSTSTENKKILSELEARELVTTVISNDSILDTVHTKEQASIALKNIVEKYSTTMDSVTKESLGDAFNMVVKKTNMYVNNGLTYNEAFRKSFESSLDVALITDTIQENLIELIQTCGA